MVTDELKSHLDADIKTCIAALVTYKDGAAQTTIDNAIKMLARIPELFDKIKHGGDDHKDWLEEAILAHFLGKPMPDYKS